MVDSQGRITLKKHLISKVELSEDHVYLYYNPNKNMIIIREDEIEKSEDEYFFTKIRLEGNRLKIPSDILKIFKKANFLPVVKNGEICILIINKNR